MADKRLNVLDETDYKVASEDPDVRGWKVMDRNDQVLGTVNHLLADVEEEKVRYLDVDPEEELRDENREIYSESAGKGVHEYRDRQGGIHMIIPIGMARVDEENKRVVADQVDKETFAAMPPLEKGKPVTLEQEKKVREYLEDPAGYHTGRSPDVNRDEVTYKSEHHTKGNENIGTRNPETNRDVSAERSTPGTPDDQSPDEELSESNVHGHSVSSEDEKHRVRTTPENSGVPNVDSRGKEVNPSGPSRNEPSGSDESPRGSRDRIRSSGRSMRPEKTYEGRMTSGAPDSLEAGATSAGSQAGPTEPRTITDRETMRNRKMDVEGNLGKDPQVREAQHRDQQPSEEDNPDFRESDESARRRIEYEKNKGKFYEHKHFDEDRFYNRK